jgi:phosphoribosylaminoimidazole-succinocarboxamide synthase
LWDIDNYQSGKLQDSFDKQILRDWLDKMGFKNSVDNHIKQGKKPDPPSLPKDIINKISDRYIQAYERITNIDFKKD